MNLKSPRPVVVSIDYVTNGVPPGVSLPVSGSTFHHMAMGGTARPGWSVVGENGPELVNFGHGGQQVIPNHMLSGGSSGSSGPIQVELHSHVDLDGREIFHSVQQETLQYNVANGTRDKRGRVRGVVVPR